MQLTFFALNRAEYTSDNILDQSSVSTGTVTDALNAVGAGAIFGSLSEWSKADSETSTNSTTPQTKAKLTTSNLPLGTYKVETYIELKGSRTNRSVYTQLWLNGDSANPLTQTDVENKDNTNYLGYSSFEILENISGVNDLEIVYFVEQNNTTASARRAKIFLYRIK